MSSGHGSAEERRANVGIRGRGWRRSAACADRANSRDAGEPIHAKGRGPSCCTCAPAMLAKPRFFRRGCDPSLVKKSKSRLNSKGLNRLAPHTWRRFSALRV